MHENTGSRTGIGGAWRKYLACAMLYIPRSVTYRLNFVASFLAQIIPYAGIYLAWEYVYPALPRALRPGGGTGWTIGAYFLVVAIAESLDVSERYHEIIDDLHEGDLSHFLIRPIDYRWYSVCTDAGAQLAYLTTSLCVGAVLVTAVGGWGTFSHWDGATAVGVVVALLITFVLSQLTSLIIGSLGFWTETLGGMDSLFTLSFWLLGGRIVPIAVFPAPLREVVELLPFRYYVSLPAEIASGLVPTEEIPVHLALGLGWVLIAWLVMSWIWRRGLRAYSARGA
jgi:ABC-2 type transport system permease protein